MRWFRSLGVIWQLDIKTFIPMLICFIFGEIGLTTSHQVASRTRVWRHGILGSQGIFFRGNVWEVGNHSEAREGNWLIRPRQHEAVKKERHCQSPGLIQSKFACNRQFWRENAVMKQDQQDRRDSTCWKFWRRHEVCCWFTANLHLDFSSALCSW